MSRTTKKSKYTKAKAISKHCRNSMANVLIAWVIDPIKTQNALCNNNLNKKK
jgi:hypothetical protein